jgi:predicted alpha/beta hydrolase
MNDAAPRKVEIAARDGVVLAATVHEPNEPDGRVVVIAGAIAVRRSFYDRFARFLASKGPRVVTFDYRGVGDSLHGDVRSQTGGLREWGERDLAAVLDYALTLSTTPDLFVVAHSVGGQLVGLADNNRCVAAILAISAQTGRWRLWPPPRRYLLLLFWTVVLPVTTRLFGYFPAARLRLGENLGKDAALEWGRWCSSEAYFVDAEGRAISGHFDDFEGALLACLIADDWMAPREAVEDLLRRFRHARIERIELGDTDGAIGHFGFFRERGRHLWNDVVEGFLPRRAP